MARPKRRKSRPNAQSDAPPDSSSKSSPADSSARTSDSPKSSDTTTGDSESPQLPPTRRQKIIFAVSLAAFVIWLVCLAVLALLK